MRNNNDPEQCKSGYNPDRTCYLSADGKYYCYDIWDSAGRTKTTLKLEVGKDGLTKELTLFLDKSDHEADLTGRYEKELRDPMFEAKVAGYYVDPDSEDAVDPWDTLPDTSSSPENVLFAEDEPESPDAAKVRRVIEAACGETRQDFFFAHFGSGIQLEEMRQTKAVQTGKLPTLAAMTSRKNKILGKVAKSLGAERVKHHRHPQKD